MFVRGDPIALASAALLLTACEPATPARPEAPAVSADVAAGETPQFYAAPNGSPQGDGSIANPWDLQTALSQTAVVTPGSTIWLRGGTYTGGPYGGGFLSTLVGTPDAPILVRQYAGERATVTNRLYTAGAYTWFWGFEITNPAFGGEGTDYDYLILAYSSVGDRFINLVLHDGPSSGIASFSPLYTTATGSTVYGCLIYNNGTHFNHDHGVYLMNDVATGTLAVGDNIVFNNWATGLHLYSNPVEGTLSGFDIEGNIVFGNGAISVPANRTNEIVVGGAPPASSVVLRDNYVYRESASGFSPYRVGTEIGYVDGSSANRDVVLERNYLVGGLYLKQWSTASVRDNLIYDYAGPMVLTDSIAAGQTWGANRFHGAPGLWNWQHAPNAFTDFATWKSQTALVAPGSYQGSGPPADTVIVRPNQYEAGRANIIVYNWSQQASVAVDLSGVLSAGDHYVVQNAQDFFGPPVASGSYDGASLQLPMAGITPAAPVGRSYTPAPVTGPTFNVFVVMKTP